MKRLEGHRALVTAAAAGIGRACALAFAGAGATVVATDIDEAGLATLGGEAPEIETARLDVTDQRAIDAFGGDGFSVLLNAAGWVPGGSALDCTPDELQRALEINLVAMHRVIRRVLPSMIAARRGSIVNIASVASSITGVPNRFAYGASKAGVIGLTKSVAADFVRDGVRCNAVCPGTIDTPSLVGRMVATGDPAAARAAFVARQPMGRLGTAQEVAALALYLASDEAAFTTGAIHVIDGGWTT